ncbi:MAG: sigma-70 family RNA polymerase sigma factor [Planctomycetota bacterium]
MTGTPAAFDVREFAAQQDFVRRLCHSLVFDQDRIDDVAQDAWLAALENPPREAGAAPTWFGRVVHNLVRRRARDDARRQRREQASARSEALPSASEVLAREQQRRRVVDAVMSLAEPYRGTVLARFFEDLQPGEIARRRGIPAATVRSHLRRALEQLREHFDRQHGGDRRAWCLLLLPLTRPAAGAGMGTVFSMTGALLMMKLFGMAGALALGLLGYLWWTDGEAALPEGPVSVASAAETPATAEVDRAAASVADAAVDAERTRQPAGPATGFAPQPAQVLAGMRGRVLEPDGTPAPDALVKVLGIDPSRFFTDMPGPDRGPSLPQGQARTDQDGVFVIEGLWPDAQYLLHADYDGDNRTLVQLSTVPRAGEVRDVGDIQLTAKGAIHGRAVDDAGRPVAGAEVLGIDMPAALAAMLPFELLEPRHGVMMSLPTPKAALDDEAVRSRMREYLAGELFLRTDLDRAEDLTTVVIDGLPWAEEMWGAAPFARTRTGDDGGFVLEGVEPGSNMLIVRRAGLAVGTRPRVRVEAGAQEDVGDVELGGGERLTGTVRAATGTAVAGAEVRAGAIGMLGYRGIAFTLAPVTTDAAGRFAVGGLPRGRAMLAVRADAAAPWHVLGPVDAGDDLDVDLPETAALELLVTRADEVAAADVEVALFAGPPMHEMRRLGMQRPLDLRDRLDRRDDGRLTLRDLAPGCYTLRVGAAGTTPTEQVVTMPHEGLLEVTLAAAAPLHVRVVDADGRPVAGARVFVHRQDPLEIERNVLPSDYGLDRWRLLPFDAGVTDADGALDVAGRPAVPVQVIATHPTWPPAEVAIDTTVHRVDLTLPRPAALRGRVFDQGAPADPQKWVVEAVPTTHGAWPLPTLRAPLDPDGSYALEALAPAPYQVKVMARTRSAWHMRSAIEKIDEVTHRWWLNSRDHELEVTIAPGEVVNLSFDVDPNMPPPDAEGARIVGAASLDGRPLAGAVLARKIDWWKTSELTTLGPDGTFVVPSVIGGKQTLVLRRGTETLWEGDVDLQSGGETRLDLHWRSGGVRGALDWQGLPPSEVTVHAFATLDIGTIQRDVPVDAQGAFELDELPAGDYRLVAQGAAARSAPITVQVRPGERAGPIALRMLQVPSLQGRVEFAGESRDGAMLLLESDNSLRGVGLEPDGRFEFGLLDRTTYTLSLRRGTDELRLEPSTFDLSDGAPRTDLVVRVVGRVEKDR